MKKLLLALLLFPIASLYADSVTPGVGFLQLSTGVYSTRSPGDVQNKNWAIAAATITTALNAAQSVIGATSTLLSASNTWTGSNTFTSTTTHKNITGSIVIGTPTVPNAYLHIVSSPGYTANLLQISTGNSFDGGASTDIFIVGNTIYFGTVPVQFMGQLQVKSLAGTKPSYTFLQNTGAGMGFNESSNGIGFFTTNTSRATIDSGGIATPLVMSVTANGTAAAPAYRVNGAQGLYGLGSSDLGFTTGGRDAGHIDANGFWGVGIGTPLAMANLEVSSGGVNSSGTYLFRVTTGVANVRTELFGVGRTSITASVAMNVKDLTITGTCTGCGAAGGGARDFDLYVGPPGATGVDAFVSTLEQFNMALASVNARGLTYPSTATARIYFANGIYKGIYGATVPAGVELVAGSSVVWLNNKVSTETFMTIYGTVRGFKFDGSGNPNRGRGVVMKTPGNLLDYEMYNASVTQSAAANYAYCMVCVDLASNVVVRGKMYDLTMAIDNTNIGNDAPFKVFKSTTVDIQLNVSFSSWPAQSQKSSFMMLAKSEGVIIHDSKFLNIGGTLLTFESKSQNNYFTKNFLEIAYPMPDWSTNSGVIYTGGFMDSAADLYQTTGTISIDNNSIVVSSGQTGGNIIYLGSDVLATGARGFRITQNSVAVKWNYNAAAATFAKIQANAGGAILQGNNIRGMLFINEAGANTLYAGQGNTINFTEQ